MGGVPVRGALQREFDARTMDDEEVEAAQGSEFRFTYFLISSSAAGERCPGARVFDPVSPGGGMTRTHARRVGKPWCEPPRPSCAHSPPPRSPFPPRYRCTVGAMSFKASKALMELRVHLCQSSAASKGVRCARVKNFPNSVVCPALE